MKNNIIAIFLMFFLFSFASASYLPHQQNQNLEFSITSNFATSCELTTINSPSGIITINQNVSGSGTFTFNISGGNYSTLGTYAHNIVCTDGTDNTSGQEFREISLSGESVSDSKIYANIILFIFFVLVVFTFFYTTRNINYEQWERRIINKYEYKNLVRVILSSIGYNVMKNKFIWYYLFGLPIILIVTDISYIFGVNSMVEFLKVVLAVYYYGFLLVTVFFFGFVLEWVSKIIDQIKSIDFGVE